MSAFRYAGCRHPVDPAQLPVMDGQYLTCPRCNELRTVREVETVPERLRPAKRDVLKVGGVLAGGKGQLALLVTDAAGVVIAGIKATGGLTQLQYRADSNTWDFAGAFSGPEVLEGSYVLRDLMGTMPRAEESSDEATDERPAGRWDAASAPMLPRRQPVLPPSDGDPRNDPGAPGRGPS